MTAPPAHRSGRPLVARSSTWMAGLAMLALVALGMGLGYRWSERNGLALLADVAGERLELYALTVESELGRYAYLPSLVAIDDDVLALLAQGGTAPGELRARAQRKLARINARAGSIAIALTDARGTLLATSQAAPSGPSAAASTPERSQFAANPRDGSTDYHFVQPVRREGRLLGHIVVTINLAPLEATWVDLAARTQSEKLMVLDDNDVVILSSVPGWKYRALAGAGKHWQPELQASGRYPPRALQPLAVSEQAALGEGARLVRLPVLEDAPSGTLLELERPILPLAVRLRALSDPAEVWRSARYAAWGGAAAAAFVALLVLYLLMRRRAVRQLFNARNALQRAHDELELKVEQRTLELRNANADLERQIAERLRIEDELIQAGKLAALGQMSAGITHEVNQPLTALRALSGNTLQLLKNGRLDAAAENLQAISDVTERLGSITSRLKSFARKSREATSPVSLRAAVANVRLLLEHRLSAEGVALQLELPEADRVDCDINRLEQVLLNLASNALDAMADAPVRRLTISAEVHDARLWVRVGDTGGGIDEATLQRLFEPFFTTKPAGQGLGLGLVISSKILREFGGTLRAQRVPGGMVFEFDLRLAQKEVMDV